jgi:uncharacterized protein YjbJ (UPF0337 family)
MNADVFKGQWLQLKGKVRQQWGRLTDDDIAEINGDRDLLLGKIQELYGRSREQAEEDLDRWLTASEIHAASTR